MDLELAKDIDAENFRDPDGCYWDVAWAASWQFDDNDMLVIEEPGSQAE